MIIQKMPPFTNVVGDGVASCVLPIGNTYNSINLKLGGTFTIGMITNIKLKLNGKTFYDISGTNLQKMNTYKGIGIPEASLTDNSGGTASDTLADIEATYTEATLANAFASLAAKVNYLLEDIHGYNASYLTIPFADRHAKTLGGQYQGSIGTASGVSMGGFTIEVTIAGATAPTLEAWAELTEPSPLGLITAVTSHVANYSAAGEYPVNLPHGKEAAHLIKRVYFDGSTVTAVEIKKNGVVVFEEMAVALNAQLQRQYKKVPQTGFFVYDPVMSNDLQRVLVTENAQSLVFDTTVSGSGNVSLISEVLSELSKI